MVYIIVDTDSGQTYGVYLTLADAEKEKASMYAGGYYGALRINEDEMG